MSTGYSAYTAKKTPFIPQKYFPRRPPRGYIRQDSRCGPARHSAPARADRRRDRHRARQLVGRHIKPEVSEHRLQHKSAFDQLLIVARELLGGLKIAVCQAGVSLLAAEYVHLCARFIYGSTKNMLTSSTAIAAMMVQSTITQLRRKSSRSSSPGSNSMASLTTALRLIRFPSVSLRGFPAS